MEKRGQITVFMLIGVAILIIVSLVLFTKGATQKKEMESSVEKVSGEEFDAVPVKRYFSRCVAQIVEDLLFDVIGLQGGYVDLDLVQHTDFDYGAADGGAPGVVVYPVPYYLIGPVSHVPELDEIKQNIVDYIGLEIDNCLDSDVFDELAYDVIPEGSLNVNVSINLDDITILINYPLDLKKGTSLTKLNDFRVIMPLRLNFTYSIVSRLVEDLKSLAQDSENPYDLEGNCEKYNSSSGSQPGVLIMIKQIEDGDDILIRILDFDTYFYDVFVGHYRKRFILQFVVKDIYLDGDCDW